MLGSTTTHRLRWMIAILVAGAIGLFFAFRPEVANHFGYALPQSNALPCRLGLGGRDYDNDEQCLGIARTSWQRWHDEKTHAVPGSACVSASEMRRASTLPRHGVGTANTLFGSAHTIFSVFPPGHDPSDTVVFVQDGRCYRPYSLSGGP